MKWKLDTGLDEPQGDYKIQVDAGRGTAHIEGEGTAHFTHDEPAGAYATFAIDSAGIRIFNLEFEAKELTVQLLRDFSISEAKQAIAEALDDRFPVEKDSTPRGPSMEELREEWPNGSNLAKLLMMVRVSYNRAVQRDLPPTKHVASVFKVSRSTASRMIAKAREEGEPLAAPVPYPGKRKKANAKEETPRRTDRDD